MANCSGEEQDETNEIQSLYEMCIDAINCTFYTIIDSKYIKDLPKHILEHILCTLSPFYLETIESKGFLNERGILTDSLWKIHFTTRFKHEARIAISESNLERSSWKSWRARYFERHFHMLIHKTAVTSNTGIEENDSPDDLNKELFRPPKKANCNLSMISPPNQNYVIDLCIKHLSSIRLHHNLTCVFLAQRQDIVAKLAPVVEHVEVGQLRDDSVISLIYILEVFLLKRKLKSFLLSNCKVENVERLRAFLKTLATSQSLNDDGDSNHLVQFKGKRKDSTGSSNGSVGDNLAKTKECPSLISSPSSCQLSKNITNRTNDFPSPSEHDASSTDTGKDMVSYSLYNDLCINEERNILDSMYSMGSDKILTKLCHKEKNVDSNFFGTQDDLYEDVFSRRTKLQDSCLESHSPKSMMESFPMKESWQKEHKLEQTSPQIRAPCLTELKLSSCLMSNASLQVLSEELIFFVSLRSLSLCEIGFYECYPAMNYLITNIGELVFHGSLRHLVFENDAVSMEHLEMFCGMLILSCESCQSIQPSKGLRSLHLAGNNILSLDRFGEVLRTCSVCEERVTCSYEAGGICYRAKDYSSYSTCKCLNNGLLKLHGKMRSFSEIVDHDYPLRCSQEKNITKNFKPDICIINPVQKNVAQKSDSMYSRHEYITSGIESLYISFNTTQASTAVLASSLLRNRCVRSLSLPSCALKTEDISIIFDCISGGDFHECNTTILKLGLRDNIFEVTENDSLCNLITKSHLVYLDLSYCGLEVIPDDVILALSSNKFLEVFKLAGNRLGNEGVNQLSKVFTSDQKTSVLNTLDLSCNRLSSCSLINFGNLLTAWPTKLREISICENPLVVSEIVRKCLQKVFSIVIIEPLVDGAMAHADYVSEM